MAYQAVGCLHNKLCRAIVLFQFEETCAVVCFLEVQYIVNVSSTEAVNTLCIIAYDADTLTFLGQLHDNGLLGIVSVLILINENVRKAFHIPLSNVLMLTEEHKSLYQQVVEIHGISLSATLSITYVYLTDGRNLTQSIVSRRWTLCVGMRQQQMVLGHGYSVCHTRRFVLFLIELHLANDTLHQRT